MNKKPFRLSSGGHLIDRSRPIRFSFDGKEVSAFAGDTVASAMMASGQNLLGRSFKYHRPRGLVGLGSEEMNALIGVGLGHRHEPNLRATQVEVYPSLTAVIKNRWPSLKFDIGAINNTISKFIPGGFYYKTFKWPRRFWEHVYEPFIRRAAGLGRAPEGNDPDTYEHIQVHCDLLVVGGGIAGLTAAKLAADQGLRVLLADENLALGGVSDLLAGEISGQPVAAYAKLLASEISQAENIQVLTRATVVGHWAQNYMMIFERLGDHDPDILAQGAPRHRLWKVRAQHIILATGMLERPIAFAHNDRPGIMLASAAAGLALRYGVAAGCRGVIFTNNDQGYVHALQLHKLGIMVQIVDPRPPLDSALLSQSLAAGIAVERGAVISHALGQQTVKAVKIARYRQGQARVAIERSVVCDFVGMSGGFNPALHLWCHNGGKIRFDHDLQSFRPDTHPDNIQAIGGANGRLDIATSIEESGRAVDHVVKSLRPKTKATRMKNPSIVEPLMAPLQPLWFTPATGKYNEGQKHFIDFQNDVTAADLELAQREGYESIEHTKRYTTFGMATDQGKTSNLNGLGILAEATGKTIPEIGVTTFRPPYTSFSFGSIAGSLTGELFLPIRKTPISAWAEQHNAMFEPVGQWRRAYSIPKAGEDVQAAIKREILAVRQHVGLLDASTLGKIEVKGPDAGAFLDRIYTNIFSGLKIGKCRYGLMLNENGFIIDDGVVVRLGKDHFLIHTTSGGADRITAWLEEWHQTEWPHYKIYIAPVTEQWAQFAVAGPQARNLLQKLNPDFNISHEYFPHMSFMSGYLAHYPIRIFRISFSGELSYEIATPAHYGRGLWNLLLEAGSEFGLVVYGTEALHVLRAEKGYIIVGDETDGTVTPHDVGLSGLVSTKKEDFLGKRSLEQPFLKSSNRKELVGLLTEEPTDILPDGAYAVQAVKSAPPMVMIGHVTSSYYSPTLDRSIAMALIENGRSRMGEVISFPLSTGKVIRATIVDPVFYDKEGARQNV